MEIAIGVLYSTVTTVSYYYLIVTYTHCTLIYNTHRRTPQQEFILDAQPEVGLGLWHPDYCKFVFGDFSRKQPVQALSGFKTPKCACGILTEPYVKYFMRNLITVYFGVWYVLASMSLKCPAPSP